MPSYRRTKMEHEQKLSTSPEMRSLRAKTRDVLWIGRESILPESLGHPLYNVGGESVVIDVGARLGAAGRLMGDSCRTVAIAVTWFFFVTGT